MGRNRKYFSIEERKIANRMYQAKFKDAHKVDMKEIISVIRTTLEAEIPKLLSVFGSGNHAKTEQENMPVTKSDDTLDDDDIDMDFIGG